MTDKDFPFAIIGVASWLDNAFIYGDAAEISSGTDGLTLNLLCLSDKDVLDLRERLFRLSQRSPIPFRFAGDNAIEVQTPAGFCHYPLRPRRQHNVHRQD